MPHSQGQHTRSNDGQHTKRCTESVAGAAATTASAASTSAASASARAGVWPRTADAVDAGGLQVRVRPVAEHAALQRRVTGAATRSGVAGDESKRLRQQQRNAESTPTTAAAHTAAETLVDSKRRLRSCSPA